MKLGPFSGEEVAGFLADYGYSTHPKGMAAPFWPDCESSDQSLKWFDVNADAVRRKNGEVPARPLRVTFHKVVGVEGPARWEMKSVEELAAGVNSKALDRQPETPKMNAPWTE
jgi:hypothetical protein